VPEGEITESGLKQNVAIGLGYLESWLRGIGCVPLFNLMEDAATAEISRAQFWQWIHHKAKLADGRVVNIALVESMIDNEVKQQKSAVDAQRYASYKKAAGLMRDLARTPKFVEFLTVPAYQRVLIEEKFVAD
jgi:malate synthase